MLHLLWCAGYQPGHHVYLQIGLTVQEVEDVLKEMNKIEAVPQEEKLQLGEWRVVKGTRAAKCSASLSRGGGGCAVQKESQGLLTQPILQQGHSRVVAMGKS